MVISNKLDIEAPCPYNALRSDISIRGIQDIQDYISIVYFRVCHKRIMGQPISTWNETHNVIVVDVGKC